ncbi:hypothetical protein [Achromobacter animicus]|uniref:hypothetical protein n=1 Tax=Achromobacter animicus TaxID=1389935 RepID=UPI00244685C4|nr:hypothetical protein [Achromobacter animicus]MDH0682937.1 hypothetical protein [Achromobacter animicus]
MTRRHRVNHASALALAQFYVIDAINGDVWYRVLAGDQWAGVEAQAVAKISLPHLVGHEIVLRAADGSMRTFLPSMVQRCGGTLNSTSEADLEILEESHQ